MNTKTLKFDDSTIEILRGLEWSGDGLQARIVKQLDRKEYETVNKALESMGGKWNRGAKAHLFTSDPREQVDGLVESGTLEIENYDFFPTPPDLARRMVELSEPLSGYSILEPSAGIGNIAKEIKKAGHECECIELNYTAAEYLKKQGYFVTCANFLEWAPTPARVTFDRIIMNPPFSKSQDIDHVTHAWNLLTPGGRIVAIMSTGTQYRQDKKSAAFRESILSHASLIETLPAGTFKQSGTNVTSILIVLEKE